MKLSCVFSFILSSTLLNIKIYATQDVVGCGGFVKSDITINYSLVEVKLYTKQGILKYQTDCAPHNGYYLLPLYDKGDYVLKVEPPTGWSFEPNSIELHVDGKTDMCSLQKDINFVFKGFLLSGKVVSGRLKNGPSGVSISLKSQDKNSKERITKTEEGGTYSFDAIQPGEYTIKANHDRWAFAKNNFRVKVTSDYVRVQEHFVVTGYGVSGRVISDEDSIRGVNFILFSKDIKQKELASSSCNPTLPDGFTTLSLDKQVEKQSALCHVTSDSNGSFIFKTLPPGNYKILAFYKGQNIKFDVRPSSMEFKIEHDDIVLSEVFQVQGFSVSGKVLASKSGKGITNANVLVTSESDHSIPPITTKTRNGGVYHLENMKVGMYKIAVSYPSGDMIFSPISVKVTPNTPQLPDILAHGFRVCGKLVLFKTKLKTSDVVLSVSVEQVGVAGSTNILTVDKTGEFCSIVKAGKYSVKPIVSSDSVGQPIRLRFKPSEAVIDISDKAKLDVVFTQFLSTISGTIKCITSKCGEGGMNIVMNGVDNDVIDSSIVKSDGKFSFEKLLPGSYKLTVNYDAWCWKDSSITVQIGSKGVNLVEFVQTGYLMTLWTSHNAKVAYKHVKQRSTLQNFDLMRGTNSVCLKEAGKYDLNVISCHEFGEDKYTYDTHNPSVMTFTAMKHQVIGKISTDVASDDIKVSVVLSDGTNSVIPVKFVEKTKSGSFVYTFALSSYPNQVITVMPTSNKLLFYPPDAQITTIDDCMHDAAVFEGRKGLFINGLITPALADVKVTVVAVDKRRSPIILQTNKNGKYDLGPLDSKTKYSVSAHKPGYVLKEIPGKEGHFKAFKLAEIKVMVINEKGRTLSGVLLSLTGGSDYRQNNVTGGDGTIVFSDLSPAQYFLRPMMKEYRFEPVSKMFNVTEGSSVQFTVIAIRVAYSCFGTVTSLTGESEPGVAIEAIGVCQNEADGNCECSQLQEDGISEQDGGTFRIRGLKPNCQYRLQLKQSSNDANVVNTHIQRSSPIYKFIQVGEDDIRDVRIIVFRHFQQMDVTANIVTSKQYLNTLKVKLYRDDNPDQPINTINIGHSSFFQLPSLPLDQTSYTLRLQTSLPRSTYEIGTGQSGMPQVTFKANTSYRHLVIHFNPKPKLMDHEALGQGTLIALPLIILVITVVYNHSKIVPMLSQANALLQSVTNTGRLSSRPRDSSAAASETDAFTNRRKIKVRKAL